MRSTQYRATLVDWLTPRTTVRIQRGDIVACLATPANYLNLTGVVNNVHYVTPSRCVLLPVRPSHVTKIRLDSCTSSMQHEVRRWSEIKALGRIGEAVLHEEDVLAFRARKNTCYVALMRACRCRRLAYRCYMGCLLYVHNRCVGGLGFRTQHDDRTTPPHLHDGGSPPVDSLMPGKTVKHRVWWHGNVEIYSQGRKSLRRTCENRQTRRRAPPHATAGV